MIDKNAVFDLIGASGALWCRTDMDAMDLADAVQFVNARHLPLMSVAPNMIQTVWAWLESSNVKIMTRFYLEGKKITESAISDVAVQVNTALRQGAHGAQIFLTCAMLKDLVEQIYVVRDDLFFNKDLIIGFDIVDVGPFDWTDIFANLRKINACAVVVAFTCDTGDKSDFVGRIYGMLNAWNAENKFDLHFAFGPNLLRIEQAQRLVERLQPELKNKLRFWINV